MSESLTLTELDNEVCEALPERSVLALVNLNSIIATNVSAAVNAATVNSVAYSEAGQLIAVWQR